MFSSAQLVSANLVLELGILKLSCLDVKPEELQCSFWILRVRRRVVLAVTSEGWEVFLHRVVLAVGELRPEKILLVEQNNHLGSTERFARHYSLQQPELLLEAVSVDVVVVVVVPSSLP